MAYRARTLSLTQSVNRRLLSMHRFRSSLALVLLSFSLPALAADGKVDGSFTANGKTFALKHAYAQTRKDPFDKKKTAVLVIVTDQELSPAVVSDDMELM